MGSHAAAMQFAPMRWAASVARAIQASLGMGPLAQVRTLYLFCAQT